MQAVKIPTPPLSEPSLDDNGVSTPKRRTPSFLSSNGDISIDSTTTPASNPPSSSFNTRSPLFIIVDLIKIPLPRYGLSATHCNSSLLQFIYESQIYGKDDPARLLSWQEHSVNRASLELVLSEPHLLKNPTELRERALAAAALYVSDSNNEEFTYACFPKNPPFETLALLGVSNASELQSRIASECTWALPMSYLPPVNNGRIESSRRAPVGYAVGPNTMYINQQTIPQSYINGSSREWMSIEQRVSPPSAVYSAPYQQLQHHKSVAPLLPSPPTTTPQSYSYHSFMSRNNDNTTTYRQISSPPPMPPRPPPLPPGSYYYDSRSLQERHASATSPQYRHADAQNEPISPNAPSTIKVDTPPRHIQIHHYQPYPVASAPTPTDVPVEGSIRTNAVKARKVVTSISKGQRSGKSSTRNVVALSANDAQNGDNHELDESSNEGDDKKSKLHVCTVPGCGKKFTRRYNLKSHQRAHLNDRPFKCQHCSTSFSRTHDLRRHIKSLHTGQRPHTCPHCHLAFARSDALKRHLKLVLERGGIIPDSNSDTSNSALSRAELEKLVLSITGGTDDSKKQNGQEQNEDGVVRSAPPPVRIASIRQTRQDEEDGCEEDGCEEDGQKTMK